MNETVDTVAKSFLKQLVKKGMKPVPIQHANFYGETYVESVQRMDREFKRIQRTPQDRPVERFEINEKDVPEKFVLKWHKKYFYGFKGSETKWTYEPRLANTVSEVEAEALIRHLASFGTPVHRLPAPLHLINPSGKKILRFESIEDALSFAESKPTGAAWVQRLKEIAEKADLPVDDLDRYQEEFETWANQQSL